MSYPLNERKQRWNDFMLPEKAPSHMFQIDYPFSLERPLPHPTNVKERVEWALQKYGFYLDQMEWLRDDKIPFLDVYTGTEIFAEAFGCKVHRPEDNMPFALPLITNASEVSNIKVPNLSECSLSMIFEIADKLKEKAGKDTILRFPDLQSPIDIASLIWDKNEFYIALIDEPEAVHEFLRKIMQLLVAFLDEWFARYGKENMAHYPDYFINRGITISEDEIGIINTEMFFEYCIDDLAALSGRYGGLGMHCCANARHQWENIKRIPDLRLLNLVQPKEILCAAYEYFADFVPQMHWWCGDGEPWTWVESYPEKSRVVMQIPVNSRDEAIDVSNRMWEACRR